MTDRNQGEKTVAEYFAGIGLVRMGLERAGWTVAFANDFSPKKQQMYQGFFKDDSRHYVVEDIHNLSSSDIPSALLATCSFPCIDLSLAGNMGGISGKHSSAFWGFVKILAEQGDSAPPLVMVENVPGWLHSNAGADFRLTVKALNDLGYACDVFTLDALRFTPQSRLRVFLVGSRAPSVPLGADRIVGRSLALAPAMLKTQVMANYDLNWSGMYIPEPPLLRKFGLADIVEKLRLDDARWWTDEEVNRHMAMMDEPHQKRVLELRGLPEVQYRTFYRRRRNGHQRAEVRNDDLSGCLRTAVGGSGKQFLIEVGQGSMRMRAMTPREYARLQGVDDSFTIAADGVQALTGFGDAVCVPAVEWIGRNVLNPAVDLLLPYAATLPVRASEKVLA